jgi:hypothetical protein
MIGKGCGWGKKEDEEGRMTRKVGDEKRRMMRKEG